MKKALAILLISLGFMSAANANNFGFRFSPLNMLIAWTDLEIDYAVTSNWMASAQITSWNLDLSGDELSISGFGLTGSYHFNGTFSDTWYVGGTYRSTTIEITNSLGSGEATVSIIGAVAGYQWVWDSFYMNLGLIAGSASDSDITIKDSGGNVTDTGSVPGSLATGLDWKLGWSF